jgi:conjugative relaxase-like TrwC/TraI family protein
MMTQNIINGANADYYRNKYFFKHVFFPGRWLGSGCTFLDLRDSVVADDYLPLFEGYSPQGVPLVRNAGPIKGEKGWHGNDWVFNWPKALTVALTPFLQSRADEISCLMVDSVKPAIALAERAAIVRFGAGGVERESAKLIIAAFPQWENRMLEPHGHIHLVTMRPGFTNDGRVGAIDQTSLFQPQLKMAMGAVARAEAAFLAGERFGISTVRDRFSFSVAGVSSRVIDGTSERRQIIEERLRLTGHKGPKASAYATLATRETKVHVPLSRLIPGWDQKLAGLGFDAHAAANCLNQPQVDQHSVEEREQSILQSGLARATEHKSHFTDLDLIRYTAEEAQCQGISGTSVLNIVDRALEHNPEIVRRGYLEDRPVYSTREILALEECLIQTGQKAQGDFSHFISRQVVEGRLAANPKLSEEQCKAVRHLALRPDAIQIISGLSGTGKTTLLRVYGECCKRQGFTLIGATQTGKAAVGLAKGAGVETSTIASLLIKLREDSRRRAIGHASNVNINEKTILVIDEAATLGTRQLVEVVQEIRRRGGKIILTGDHRQSQSIEFGGGMVGLARRLGQIELKEIRRQRDGWAREAVKQFGDGDAKEMVQAWSEGGIVAPREHIMLTGTRAEAKRANLRAQEATRQAGVLSEEYVELNDTRFHVNDRVMFLKNNTPLGVRNGQLGTIVELRPSEEAMLVQSDQGGRVLIPYRDYSHLSLGYALTTYKSQGVTVRYAYCLVPEMTDRELTVVQASRHKLLCTFFVDQITAGPDLAEMTKAMERSRQQVLATDATRRHPSYVVLKPEFQR